MHIGGKTKQCVGRFDCRFKVALMTAVALTLAGIVGVFLFGG